MSEVPSIYLIISGVVFVIMIAGIFLAVSEAMKSRKELISKSTEARMMGERVSRFEKEFSEYKSANEELNAKNVALSTRTILLSQVVESVTSSLDPNVIYQNIIESTVKLLDARQCMILILAAGGRGLLCKAAHGFSNDEAKAMKFSPEEGVFGFILKNGHLLTSEDLKNDFKLADLNKDLKLPFLMAAPLFGEEKTPTGIIFVNSLKSKDNTYSKEDVRLFQIVSMVASLSLRNARLFKKTEMMANTDGLTKLYTHRYFQGFLDEEIYRSQRYKRKVSIILTDIDHFKNFNDTYGHQIGDFVLEETAKIFKQAVRTKIDLVARYGGEEFIAVLPETDTKGAKIFAERLRRAVEEHKFMDKDSNQAFRVTMSLGIATYPDHSTDKIELIKKADNALYEAKEGGRNRVCEAKK